MERPRRGRSRPTSLRRPSDVRLDQFLAEAGGLQLGAHVLGPVGVLRLEPVVQDNVAEHAPPEPRQQRSRLGGLDPLETPAQPRLWRDSAVGLQHQRIEEERAELPVAGPGLAVAQALERPDVHEDRFGAVPLDVVGAPVLEHEAFRQRLVEEPELQKGGRAQHLERPLVRIGDERHALVAQQSRRDLLRGDDASVLERSPKEARALERGPVLLRARRKLTQHLALGRVDDARLGIAKGGRLWSVASSGRHPCGFAGYAAGVAT